MQRVYAPWRTEYLTNQTKKIDGCVFCHIAACKEDEYEELGVLYKGEDFFIVMNKYPYTPGHFMIIPNMHTANLEDLPPDTFKNIAQYSQKGVKMLKEVLNAQGVNLGMNLGSAAGAGIKEHIHMHLVPRYQGDTNFITTIGDTRVYGTNIDKLYTKLRENVERYFKL